MPLFSHHTRPPQPDRRGPGSARFGRPLGTPGPGQPADPGAAPTFRMPAPDPAPGSGATALLKRYRPLETRAAGGFGSVEICLDVRLQRRVAIKRMPLAAQGSTPAAETRHTALAEARTASLLQHPNIVSVIDFSYDEAYAYLVMEYVDGMTLEEFLREVDGHSLTYDECAHIADALVQALSYAHENGVLHLDIKPANVLIDRAGHVKLTDFGMAALTGAAGFSDARGGTIGYMSPEQLAGDPVDERADLFALAAVLYESLCADAPFRAGTPAASLKRIKQGVTRPSELLPDIPAASEEALIAALAPDAHARPASVEVFGDAFLARLGSAREGRRSLERMIARLTTDDADTEDVAGTHEHRPLPLDPAEGRIGSRDPRARRRAARAIAGAAAAVAAWPIFAAAGVGGAPALLAATGAVALAAGLAPQLGSALIAAGLITLVVSATELVAVLPAAALMLALFAGWWYAWGRVSAPASAVFCAQIALGIALGSMPLAAGPVAAVAGCLLPPVSAAAASGVGAVTAALAVRAIGAGGVLTGADALAVLIDPHALAGIALAALTAAAVSAVLDRAWRRIQSGRGAALVPLAYAVAGIMVVLLLCLANPVKNPSSQAIPFLGALGMGALSSIIVWIYILLFGYRKEPAEGDRS